MAGAYSVGGESMQTWMPSAIDSYVTHTSPSLNGFAHYRRDKLSIGMNAQWKFRKPASLDELAAFVTLELQAICTLSVSSDYRVPYVGGTVQIDTVAPPRNVMQF
jgi:hypothetical protein